jgi:hypothetical protein
MSTTNCFSTPRAHAQAHAQAHAWARVDGLLLAQHLVVVLVLVLSVLILIRPGSGYI